MHILTWWFREDGNIKFWTRLLHVFTVSRKLHPDLRGHVIPGFHTGGGFEGVGQETQSGAPKWRYVCGTSADVNRGFETMEHNSYLLITLHIPSPQFPTRTSSADHIHSMQPTSFSTISNSIPHAIDLPSQTFQTANLRNPASRSCGLGRRSCSPTILDPLSW